MVQIILFLIFAVINAVIAKKKGFSPWAWVLAAGIIGIMVLYFMPHSNEPGINEQTEIDRRKAGNLCGVLLSILALIIFVAMTIKAASI